MQFTIDLNEILDWASENVALWAITLAIIWYVLAGLVVRKTIGTVNSPQVVKNNDGPNVFFIWALSPVVLPGAIGIAITVMLGWYLCWLLSAGLVPLPSLKDAINYLIKLGCTQ